MPQFDRHKKRVVNIEFIPTEDFTKLPYEERFSIVFLTSGTIKGIYNDRPIKLNAPEVLCISREDCLHITEKENVCAQSFCFHEDFLNSIRFSDEQGSMRTNFRIRTGLSLFNRDQFSMGITNVTEKAYPKLFEWFFIMGTEVTAQSDSLWVCRIKKYLIQLLGMLENLSRQSEQSAVDLALDYIFTNYANKITLEDLTEQVHVNRVTLNQLFKERCGCTAMNYLIHYRLQVAGDLLIHTDMTLNDIACSTGFEYDSYFIKQFTAKRGMSPTTYRIVSREHALSI